MDETSAPDLGEWGAWLRNVAQYGLMAKWDAEYKQPYTPNGTQTPGTPAPAGTIKTSYVLVGGAVLVGVAALAFALSD